MSEVPPSCTGSPSLSEGGPGSTPGAEPRLKNALRLAWKARQRIWARETKTNGQALGKLRELSREEMDNLLAELIFAIEEERQDRHADALFDMLEEAGLLEKAEIKLTRFED